MSSINQLTAPQLRKAAGLKDIIAKLKKKLANILGAPASAAQNPVGKTVKKKGKMSAAGRRESRQHKKHAGQRLRPRRTPDLNNLVTGGSFIGCPFCFDGNLPAFTRQKAKAANFLQPQAPLRLSHCCSKIEQPLPLFSSRWPRTSGRWKTRQ